MIGKLSYYEQWIVAFAKIPLRKEVLNPTEIALKLRDVQARWPAPKAGTTP